MRIASILPIDKATRTRYNCAEMDDALEQATEDAYCNMTITEEEF